MENIRKRIFIATFVDSALFKVNYPFIKQSFTKAIDGKWVEVHNLHFTVKFLGHVENEKVDGIISALDSFLKHYDSKLLIKGISILPHLKKPKVLFAKVFNPDKTLLKQFLAIESTMQKLGFQKEKSKFIPHVSFLRVKNWDRRILKEKLTKYKEYEFGSMPGFTINLVESQLTNEGPIYTILK